MIAPWRRWGRRALIGTALLLTTLALIAPLSAWLGQSLWWLAMCAYGMPAAALLAFAALVLCALMRAWRGAAYASLVLVASLYFLAPLYWPQPAPAASAPATLLRLLSVNVYEYNTNAAPLLALIAREQPDIIVMQEVTPEWEARLVPLHADYPQHKVLPRMEGGYSNLAVYSRLPVASVVPLWRLGLPALEARLRVGSGELVLLDVHTAASFSRGRAQRFREQMRRIADYVQSVDGPLVLAGDFNATPWSAAFRELRNDTGLRHARAGQGILGTWPAPLGWLGTPLDHVLVRGAIEVRDFRVLENIGSDHRPILAEVAVDLD